MERNPTSRDFYVKKYSISYENSVNDRVENWDDLYFTTPFQVIKSATEILSKAVGKGTGLGLAIAHQIIVEKYGGEIIVNSTERKGTEFIILLGIGNR